MYGSFEIYLAAFGVALAGFVALWGLSLRWRDASVVDFWWGPGFLAQVLVADALADGPLSDRGLLVGVLVGAWAVRLGVVLGRRRIAEGHEDPRYAALRAAWDPGFWWKSLFLVFLLQAVLQSVIAWGPIAAALAPATAIGALGMIGVVLAMAGLGLETVADAQLDAFKRRAAPGDLCDTGLRAHIRHPNYAGEILFWAGVALLALEAGAWIGLVGAALVAALLTSVSGAPVLDDRLGATRPGWRAYRARVPAFVPALGRTGGRDRRLQ